MAKKRRSPAALTVVTEKGGTGKSSAAFSIGWLLSEKKRVLLIDMDPQKANLSWLAGIPKTENTLTVLDILDEKCEPMDAVVTIKDGLDIIPATDALQDLATPEHVRAFHARTGRRDYYESLIETMTNALMELKKHYDLIILDTNPRPDTSHVLSLCATDKVLIPLLPDVASLEGESGTAESIKTIRESVNPDLSVLGLVFVKDNDRTNLGRQVHEIADQYAKELDSVVLDSSIRNSVLMAESSAVHQGITDYAPKSKIADDVRAVVEEIERRL